MDGASVARPRAIALSVVLHVALAAIMIFGLDFGARPLPRKPPAPGKVIEAVAVDSATVEKEIQRLKAAGEKKQREAQRALEQAEQKRRAEEQQLQKLKAEQEQIKKKENERRAQLEVEKKRIAAEKEKLAVAERKKAEAQKRLAAEKEKLAVAERKKAEAQKRLERQKKQAAEEQRRLAEEKRKAEEQHIQQALKDELAAEEREAAAAAQLRSDEVEMNRYIAAIQNRVAAVFIYPDLEQGLSCTLYVRMIPGGEVIEARVTKSSGNPSFDRQAEVAVRKAAPLPVPSDPRLFQRMSEIRFVFDPEH